MDNERLIRINRWTADYADFMDQGRSFIANPCYQRNPGLRFRRS